MPGLVFFIDVDNTLIDNDGVKKDLDAHPNFKPDITVLHIGDDLVMYDRYSGQELVHIKQRVLSLLPRYEIYRNGQHWATMHEQFRLFGERFKVEGSNGMVFHVNGDIWRWNFSVTDNYGNLMAQIGRQFSLFRDSYAVDVAPGVDAPFVIALAIVIEMVKEHHEKKDE